MMTERIKEEDYVLDIGQAMKTLREKKGLTQGDIVRRTGLERSYVSRLEGNKIKYPRIKMICRIAQALEVSVDEFVKLASNSRG